MYIKVRVLPGAKREGFSKIKEDTFEVSVREEAKGNRANTRVRELLGEKFGVAPAAVRLVSGHTSSHKIFSVPDNHSK